MWHVQSVSLATRLKIHLAMPKVHERLEIYIPLAFSNSSGSAKIYYLKEIESFHQTHTRLTRWRAYAVKMFVYSPFNHVLIAEEG